MMQLGCRLIPLLLLLAGAGRAQHGAVSVSGTVVDSTQAAIAGARVLLRNAISGIEATAFTDPTGSFNVQVVPGEWAATVTAADFGVARATWRVDASTTAFRVVLDPADLIQNIKVTAGQIVGLPEQLERLPGSVGIVSATTLQESHVLTTDEALIDGEASRRVAPERLRATRRNEHGPKRNPATGPDDSRGWPPIPTRSCPAASR